MEATQTYDAHLAEFEDRIARGEKIEPGDWMPEAYRKQLIRMISQHAHSEIVGMLPEGKYIPHAPSLRRKMVLIAKVQDEAGHGQYLYHAAETLGATREEMIDALLTGKAKYSSVFNYPTLTWADIGMIGWLVDGAAIKNQLMLSHASYGPYSRAMVRICAEETFHYKQGMEMIVHYATNGTSQQRAMAQDALNRWWWPSLMMFGPHDSDSPNSAQLIRWGIKTKTNDELRNEFVTEMVEQFNAIGLTVPDPDMVYDAEREQWIHGPIDWDEFWQVVRGNGPMNAERLAARRKAHDDGLWVREALVAFAQRA
ncbi:MAG: 1,2-phenylacetyl-CoA epoxidase subunit A [Anaerolineae bacterium]|nr:1,2-phenylacetyl-CoA epoxidase subunit A [Anaerolineae bacterium]